MLDRDQFAILVAVERIAEMLYADAAETDGPTEVRIEYGSISGWDDVRELYSRANSTGDRRYQVKRQSTTLKGDVVLGLLRDLGHAPDLEGVLVLRDLVSVAGVGEIRILRDLCHRSRDADWAYLAGDLQGVEAGWVEHLAAGLNLEHEPLLKLLSRFTVETRDQVALERLAVKTLRTVVEDPQGAFEAIHSYVARHPDGAVPYTPSLVYERILRMERPTETPDPRPLDQPWVALGQDLRDAPQHSWWTRLLRFLEALESEPSVRPHLHREERQPGERGFLWSLRDAPGSSWAHGDFAYNTLRFFTEEEVPSRIGDYAPRSHALFLVRSEYNWPAGLWADHRRDLFDNYIEPIIQRVLEAQGRSGATRSSTSEEEHVWVFNQHPLAEVFRPGDDGEGFVPADDIGSIPASAWCSDYARRWREQDWLREVPTPPWATAGRLLYRHEHPTQPYITAFRVNDPLVPLRVGDVIGLSDLDMTLPHNAHLRRHWLPRRSISGPMAGRLNHIQSEHDPEWMDGLPSMLRPTVDFGLTATTLVPVSLAVVDQLASTRLPGFVPRDTQGKHPARGMGRTPMNALLSTLWSIRDENGLSVVRLGDMRNYLNDHELDLAQTLDLMQGVKQSDAYVPDSLERFAQRLHPGEVFAVRLGAEPNTGSAT